VRSRSLSFALAFIGVLLAVAPPCLAQTSVLSGRVSSDNETRMEGVVVSAKRADSIVTVSVVSDEAGLYQFPAGRLPDGHYALTIRAAGYDLDHPEMVDVAVNKASVADLHLKPARQLADQLTNAEWLASAPGGDDIKRHLLNCTDCHSLARIFKSQHSKDEFLQVFARMGGY
jgi:virginiamycin B lyase